MSGRFISFIEKNQLALSIVFSSGTYIAQNHFELKKQKVEKARLKLHDKIHNLYAPIVGNRLLHNSAVEAIEEVHGKSVENVVADICLRKKGSDLEDWRCFYQRHLDALDKKFLELVEKNSHLVRNSDDLKLIQSMVSVWFSIICFYAASYWLSIVVLSNENHCKPLQNINIKKKNGFQSVHGLVRRKWIQLQNCRRKIGIWTLIVVIFMSIENFSPKFTK